MAHPERLRHTPGSPVPPAGALAPGRALVRLVVVLAVAAACLRAADAVPGLLTGTVRGVRQFRDIEALEHALGWRVPLPSYFPDSLGWPPVEVRGYGQSAAMLLFARRDNSAPWLLLGIGSGQNESLPAELVAHPLVLQDGPSQVNGAPAVVRRVRDGDGVVWTELAWHTRGRLAVMRYRGPLHELEMMASSLQGRLR